MQILPFQLSIALDEHGAFVFYAFSDESNLVMPIDIPDRLRDIGTRLLESPLPVFYDDPHELGRELGQILYPPEVQDMLSDATQNALRTKRRVQIQLQIAVPELAALPWEWASIAHPQPWAPARTDDFPVVRHSAVAKPAQPIVIDGPLRVLICVTDADADALRVISSLLAIEVAQQRIFVDVVVVTTITDIEVALQRTPVHILHCVAPVQVDHDQVLTMRFEEAIDIDDFRDLLTPYPTIGMVVITPVGPQSAQIMAYPQIYAALLLNNTLMAAIAFGGVCRADVVTRFAATCYNAIIDGMPIDLAVSHARRTLGNIDVDPLWGYPQLRLITGGEAVFSIAPPHHRVEWIRSAGIIVVLVIALVVVTLLGRYLRGDALPPVIQMLLPHTP